MPYDAFLAPDYGPILLVKVVEDHTGSFPVGFYSAYKCLVCVPDGLFTSEQSGVVSSILPTQTDRYVIGLNFRPNRIRINSMMLAFKVTGQYVLDNQAVFQENI